MHFPSAKFSKQPLPDEFYTWLHVDITGHIANNAAATGTFGFALNNPVYPLNSPGGAATTIPNPQTTSLATLNPSGMSILLQNNGTGIWTQYRVWGLSVELTVIPGGDADGITHAIAPISGSAAAYGTVSQMGQAPGACSILSTIGANPQANTLKAFYSMPTLAGVTNTIFGADDSYAGTFTTAPESEFFVQWRYATAIAGTVTTGVGYKLHLAYHVQFFSRTDAALVSD